MPATTELTLADLLHDLEALDPETLAPPGYWRTVPPCRYCPVLTLAISRGIIAPTDFPVPPGLIDQDQIDDVITSLAHLYSTTTPAINELIGAYDTPECDSISPIPDIELTARSGLKRATQAVRNHVAASEFRDALAAIAGQQDIMLQALTGDGDA